MSPQIPQYGTQQFNPEIIYRNQQYAFQHVFTNHPQQHFPEPQFYNPLQPLKWPQSQPQQHVESQPSGSQFKGPQTLEPGKGKGKNPWQKKQ